MSKKQRKKKKAQAFATVNAAGMRAIGQFTVDFSQLEYTIRALLAINLALQEKHFDIVTAPYDFRMLCTVSREVLIAQIPKDLPDDAKQAKAKVFEKWCSDCLTLNDDRVRIAHGFWTFGLTGPSARHVSRGKLRAEDYFGTPDSIVKLSDAAQALMKRTVLITVP